jgi:predicted transcriptional regulator
VLPVELDSSADIISLTKMPVTRHDLTLEEKISLLKDKDNGMTYRKLAEKYNVSLGAVTNIMKRRGEYLSDYEDNQNKAASMIILVKNKVLFVFYHEKKI